MGLMADWPDLYLMRHGQTVWNAEGRMQGRLGFAADPAWRSTGPTAGLVGARPDRHVVLCQHCRPGPANRADRLCRTGRHL
ncbi:histidine phosphatase family protein [Paracoccus sp. (in: a-proteobacteria)]|uniref:histidine phosphatase family protein n=1 Tax=Paracoccus sp. TaxID=267 RepID=UPI003A4C6E43